MAKLMIWLHSKAERAAVFVFVFAAEESLVLPFEQQNSSILLVLLTGDVGLGCIIFSEA